MSNIDEFEVHIQILFEISKKHSYLFDDVWFNTSHPYPIQIFYFVDKLNQKYKHIYQSIFTTYEHQFIIM